MISSLPNLAVCMVAFCCLLAAALIDVKRRLIPNRLVLAIMGAGVALRLLAGSRLLWLSFLIWACLIGLLGLLAIRSLLGWGDVKLIAAVTLLVPPAGVALLLPAIVIAGGILSCGYLLAGLVLRRFVPAFAESRVIPRRGLGGFLDIECARIRAHESMPYGVAILGGVLYFTAITVFRCLPAMFC